MRHIVAALVGAIVVFMWGFTAWAALDLYKFAFPPAGNEVAITEALKEHLTMDGAYMLPATPAGYGSATTDPATQAAFNSFEMRMKSGPVALVFYNKTGMSPMEPMALARGFGIEFACSLLLTCLLSTVVGGIGKKVFFGFTVALFGATACYGVTGNFMHFPLGFTFACWIDALISWTLCSYAISVVLTRGYGKSDAVVVG
ncbi:MAG: hypothetical protein DWI10_10045 [Planctomycetota bacterium]|jgi:hypothetical protein|nr:MAG: hypothetical protein DWI10_10045 [Planctomycetota bacterium]